MTEENDKPPLFKQRRSALLTDNRRHKPTSEAVDCAASTDREDIVTATNFLRCIDTGSTMDIAPDAADTGAAVTEASHSSPSKKKKSVLKVQSRSLCCHTIRQAKVDLSQYPASLKSAPLKASVNLEFSNSHPSVQLKLSQIVNLRENLIFKLCTSSNIEACTASIAWLSFERLIGEGSVTRSNCKQYACACVLLAYKFIEEIPKDSSQVALGRLIGALTRLCGDETNKKSILKAEFTVYELLGFDLHLTRAEIEPSFDMWLQRMDQQARGYLLSV